MEDRGDAEQIFVHAAFLDGASILDGLCPSALARLALSNKELRKSLMQERPRLWFDAVSSSLPGFELSESLFTRPHEFLAFLRDFSRATAVPGLVIPLGDADSDEDDESDESDEELDELPRTCSDKVLRLTRLEDAQKLQERLRIAFQIAEEHVATGGTYAQVFLAPLVLPELSNKVRFWMDSEEGFHPDLVFGQPIVLPGDQAPQQPADAKGGRLQAASEAKETKVARPALCLYFARLQHQLLMAARDDGAPPVMIPLSVPYSDARRPTQGSMKITVDVSVADMKHQLFHFRGITLTVNGPWADCCGLYAPPMGRDLFAPSDGGKAALSIVCLRDDGVYRPCDVPRAQSDTFAVAKLPDALHLDCLRGRPIVEVRR
ncbi:unnamed protein product [Durusdinium trenchii]|uniref:Uncharacterized protein n=1 Tax=Durusdinium trenchii TaxID=1381693 RepID=A0ABP0R522_9DINO